MKCAILLALASCVTASDPLGATLWEIEIDRVHRTHGGRGGHVAISTFDTMLLVGPDGTRVWEVPLAGQVLDHVVDEAGAVVAIHRTARDARTSRLTGFASDGTVAWSHEFAEDTVNINMVHLVLDVENVAWLFYPEGAGWRWQRYSPAGVLLGSDVLYFVTASTAAALPTGGIAIGNADGGVTLFDKAGVERGRVDAGGIPGFVRFVVHDDGELTVQQDDDLVRLDATHQERWRVTGRFTLPATPLSDGSLLVTSADGIGGRTEVEVLHRIDRDGAVNREVRHDDDIHVVDTPPPGGYRLEIGPEPAVPVTRLIARALP